LKGESSENECTNLPLCFTPLLICDYECSVKRCIFIELHHGWVWPTACTLFRVHMILTSLSNLPETMGLFLIGLVLILSGIVLRRVFLTLETTVTAPGQSMESKEQPLK